MSGPVASWPVWACQKHSRRLEYDRRTGELQHLGATEEAVRRLLNLCNELGATTCRPAWGWFQLLSDQLLQQLMYDRVGQLGF